MRLLAVMSLTLTLLPSLALAEKSKPKAPVTASADQKVEEADDEQAQLEAFEASLDFQAGDVTVGDNLATLHLGDSLRFLASQDAAKLLEAWGNPPGDAPLGVVMKKDASPFAESSWAVVVTYADEGHVDDEDAKDIDFDDLLSDMKEEADSSNEERKKAGFPEVKLVGWAEPPHYDSSSRKLYWAKELDFGEPKRTLNYNIRVLGRTGVLELTAVAPMDQLAAVKSEMPHVLKAVEFNPGMRYADFSPGADKVAAYGIGALVAGKVAAKVGLFKVIVAALIASKKLIAAAAIGLGLFVKKLLFRKKDDADETPTA